MRRALLPWLFPVVLVLALLIAVTNSPIVYVAVVAVLGWGLLPVALSWARRSGTWPQWLGGGSDPNRRRFPGL
jgi:xanthine/uracil permease